MVTDRVKRHPHEEYLLPSNIHKHQASIVKRILGIKSSRLTDLDCKNILAFSGKDLGGQESNLTANDVINLMKYEHSPNYRITQLSGKWKQYEDFFGTALNCIDESPSMTQEFNPRPAIIDKILPLNNPEQNYVPITFLLPNNHEDVEKKELEGYRGNWQHYELSPSEFTHLAKQDATFPLKLFLAFSFVGLAQSTQEENNGSKIFNIVLNTAGLLGSFNYYDANKFKSWLSGEDEFITPIDNIFRRTSTAYLTIPKEIVNIMRNSRNKSESGTSSIVPSVKLNDIASTQFSRLFLNKPRDPKKDKHYYNRDAEKARKSLSYLFCMTSGTAITINLPKEKVAPRTEKLQSPLLVLPEQWQDLLQGVREDNESEYSNIYKNYMSGEEPLTINDIVNMPSKMKSEFFQQVYDAFIDIEPSDQVKEPRCFPDVSGIQCPKCKLRYIPQSYFSDHVKNCKQPKKHKKIKP